MPYIKEAYFHVKGTPTNETDDMNVKNNYIMATLEYTKGIGYTWSIKPIGQYTVYEQYTVCDEKYGNHIMNVITYGVFSKIYPEIWRECLIECSRRGKAKEREAIELFESNVVNAITHRLRYEIDNEDDNEEDFDHRDFDFV